MVNTDQDRLRAAFLNDASHLLAITSPAAAAFLGSTRDRLLDASETDLNSKEIENIRRKNCGACGNPLIPGWSCTVALGPRNAGKRVTEEKHADNPMKSETTTVYTCLRCNRKTTHEIQKRSITRVKKTGWQSDEKTVLGAKLSTEVNQKVQKTVNASSKQRQKARKGGLQAMLERTKTQASNSAGLDLMDFAL